MRVTDYEVLEVVPRWVFVKVETSTGLVGWGECVNAGGGETMSTAVEELLETCILGEDPLRIADHWQKMYRGGFYRGGPVLMAAIAGIDQALWDVKGKHYGAPVHELLGGKVRDRLRVYTWIAGDRPSEVAEDAREKVDAGFTALKMNATEEVRRIDSPAVVDAAADRMAEAREEVGDEVDVALDFHGRVPKSMAKRIAAAVEPYDPMFIEEPVLPENNEFIPELAAHTTTPIATGERMFSRWEFKDLFARGGVDVIQPDLSHAGGISEVHKIGAMAEAHDVAMAPHCPLGPIALAACLQVDATSHNAVIQEQSLGIHYNRGIDLRDYLADPEVFAYEDGYVEVPDGPGLGVEIEEDRLEEIEYDGDRSRTPWRHDDGSIAEW